VTSSWSAALSFVPGALQVAQICWEKETEFRLPVRVWREMMDHYYPNCAWLSLRQDIFDRLYRYKIRHGLPTWDETFEKLLPVLEAWTRR
jgi:hypothetical protein